VKTQRSLSARGWLIQVVAVLAVAALALPAAIDAASPSPSAEPSASPSEQPFDSGIDAWLDRPVPTDAPVGSTIRIGATIWGRDMEQLLPGMLPFIRLRPATGSAAPAEQPSRQDWPGHVFASLEVPEGGAGTVEIGMAMQACGSSGCDGDMEFLFTIAGFGPPPGAPLPAIATATIEPMGEPVIAGQPIEIRVRLEWLGDWEDGGDVHLPGQVFVLVREPRGPDIDSVAVPASSTTSGLYEGSVTFPGAGDYALEVSTKPVREITTTFSASTLRVSAAPGPDGPIGEAGGPPLPIVLVVAIALLVLSIVARRAIADL
jgi:hypothetical protein